MVQPAFAYFGGKTAYGTCSKSASTKAACSQNEVASSSCKKNKPVNTGCSKKKCNKSSKSQNKDGCNRDGCNPTLGCSSGNFFVHHHNNISLLSWLAQKQKAILIDDNRISKNLSECWRPPKA